MLTHKQYMQRLREVTAAWSKRYSARIPNEYPAGSNPHPGEGQSDYAQHHAQYGARPEYIDLLEEQLAEVDREWAASPEATGRH